MPALDRAQGLDEAYADTKKHGKPRVMIADDDRAAIVDALKGPTGSLIQRLESFGVVGMRLETAGSSSLHDSLMDPSIFAAEECGETVLLLEFKEEEEPAETDL